MLPVAGILMIWQEKNMKQLLCFKTEKEIDIPNFLILFLIFFFIFRFYFKISHILHFTRPQYTLSFLLYIGTWGEIP